MIPYWTHSVYLIDVNNSYNNFSTSMCADEKKLSMQARKITHRPNHSYTFSLPLARIKVTFHANVRLYFNEMRVNNYFRFELVFVLRDRRLKQRLLVYSTW